MRSTTTVTGIGEGSSLESGERPCLTIVHHEDGARVGVRLVLTQDDPLLLGRGRLGLGAGVLDDPGISRAHARVACRRDGVVRVRDEGSHNGTFVNGARVADVALEPGDLIGVGSILLLFHRAPAVYPVPRHERIVGVSHTIAAALRRVEQVATHRTTVLVVGETGTGKELVARDVHDRSGRRGPFSPVNCGGVNDGVLQSEMFGSVRGAFSGADRDRVGVIEATEGGTVFLDEIGDASAALQRSLLRVLQESAVRRVGAVVAKPVDVRFVAATHRDLEAMVAEGSFREDLYARLSGWVIQVPPLRARREDIPHIVSHTLRALGCPERRVDRSLALRLMRHPYPRNVRELRKIVEQAVIEATGDRLQLSPALESVLSPPGGGVPREPAASRDPEAAPRAPGARPSAQELRDLVAAHGGNVTRLAAALGVGRNTLYRWLRAAGLDAALLR